MFFAFLFLDYLILLAMNISSDLIIEAFAHLHECSTTAAGAEYPRIIEENPGTYMRYLLLMLNPGVFPKIAMCFPST